ARATARNGDGKSLSASEKFIALQKRLNVPAVAGFSYYDLPVTATQGPSYSVILALARYGGVSDLFRVPLPEPLGPPLDVLAAHLEPAGSVSWVDDSGVHGKSLSPFPGSTMLSEPGIAASVAPAAAIMTATLLPSLNRSRETANRVRCAADLRTLG